MTLEPKDAPARPASRLLLVLAAVITLAVLPYAWGRTVVMWMLIGRPEGLYAALFAAGVVAVLLLTLRAGTWSYRLVAAGVALGWIIVNGVIVGSSVGPQLPLAYVLVLFVAASLWVPWAAWMYYWPVRGAVRWGVLALLLLVTAGSGILIKAEGLTGDARVNFAWRWDLSARERRATELGAETVAVAVDLTRVTGQDYPQFMGPLRLGVAPHARLARDWDARPPRLLWRRSVGAGWGAFAIVGDYAVTQEQRGTRECVVCYRLRDGATAWVHEDEIRFDASLGGPGPRATPTVIGGRVYTLGATGLLNCLDGASGKAIWSVDILKDNDAGNISHGVCSSPLLVDEKVLVCPTGKNGPTLAAYHRDTGQRLWQGGTKQAGYGSPLLAELDGVRQVLLTDSTGVAGYDPDTGTALWEFAWSNTDKTNCSQPWPNAGGPGQVFVSTGYGKGCALVRVERGTSGVWSATPRWQSRAMKTKFTSAVEHRGHIYGLDDGILECLDLKKGKIVWKDGRYGHGQILLAGDLLIVQAEDGEVVLVDPSPEGLRELGRLPALAGKTWNHPAVAGRYLLVRNDQEAACYELELDEN